MKKYIALIIIVIAVVAFGWFIMREGVSIKNAGTVRIPIIQQQKLITSVVYTCDHSKTISAAFYDGSTAPKPAPNQPPTPTGSVEISFNGAASSTLYQTISADGARYANSNESLVFWSKGDSALIMRNNSMDPNYTNCTVSSH